MNHPYTPPSAEMNLNELASETYEPKLIAINGRIGRLRYLGYSMAASMLMILVFSVLAGIGAAVLGSSNAMLLGSIALLLFYVPSIAISLIYARRRLHDLNQNGWLSLLIFVPFFAFYLIFAPGTKGPNQYGAEPSKNSTAMIILAIVLPLVLFAVIGIIAAISIPAYQKYQERARAAEVANMPKAADSVLDEAPTIESANDQPPASDAPAADAPPAEASGDKPQPIERQ